MELEKLVQLAREEGATSRQDMDAERDVSAALTKKDVDKARHILAIAASCLERGERMPRIFELYLGEALDQIAVGNDPSQSLHLKRNSRKKISDFELTNIYCCVERYRQEDNISERKAIAKYSAEIGVKISTAEKQYEKAKKIVGVRFDAISKFAQSLELRKGVAKPSEFAHLIQQLSGTSTKLVPSADEFKRGLVNLLGVPKKG